MRIDFVEIANFRKLKNICIELAADKTVFVGANNSGKTSAMIALRHFLVERERTKFSLNDFTLCHWPAIDRMGAMWETPAEGQTPPSDWERFLPQLDVWLSVDDNEVHYVQPLIPTLDWAGGRLGVRLRFEPEDTAKLQSEYLAARALAKATQSQAAIARGETEPIRVKLWPENLTAFLQRKMNNLFKVRAYILDPALCRAAQHGVAQPQPLAANALPLESDPFKGLIQINEINAQRGFGIEGPRKEAETENSSSLKNTDGRKLSEQLRKYYNNHLDPNDNPDAEDLIALQALEDAQSVFDARLRQGFSSALGEITRLGYPGVSDPSLNISTKLQFVDGLRHEAAVQYVVKMTNAGASVDLRLPEDSNGLGYQNLISMIFRLMSFRDSWMRVGKAMKRQATSDRDFIPPLQLILIEEPEAHLHTQVQQVFIRQAYRILRSHPALQEAESPFKTQMIVSTHSSHIAHECPFSALRYFRRMPPQQDDIPTSCVVNLTNVFGGDQDTERFVTRYLMVTHCDLFFADGAVIVEGPAERILVPHFIQHTPELDSLSECYLTWLEINGSHAHRLRPLIEKLGLTTLIITDLDAIAGDAGAVVPPARNTNQGTKNHTLRTWCPERQSLDELLDLPAASKVKAYNDEKFSIRVAYQTPITVTFKQQQNVEALATTLEDALVFTNLPLFTNLQGIGLVRKFRESIAASETVAELTNALFNDLDTKGKAELALDLLEIENPADLVVPAYIRDGLIWLAAQLRKQQEDLGLIIAAAPAQDVAHTPVANGQVGQAA